MYLLFDIGGTKTRIAISNDGKSFSDSVTIPTEKDFDEGMQKIKEAADNIILDNKITMISAGVAGSLNKEKTGLLVSPNISGWMGKSITQKLEDMFGAKALLENDSALAALGESVFGSGRDFNIVAYITVGTGVGGARVVGKKIDANSLGFEPGHQIIDFHEAENRSDALRGELEDYTGGRKIEERYGKPAQEINDEDVWKNIAKAFAYGVNNAIVFWSPDVVILGGTGIIKKPGISAKFVKEILKDEILKIFPIQPEIKESSLGDQAGLYGALAILEQYKH